MSTTTASRQPKGIPVGGQFAATAHAEPDTVLTPAVISVPSDASLYRLVYEDRPSNAERRSYGRQALEQSLEGDFFNAVHSEDAQAEIRDEAERDNAMDRALDRIGHTDTKPHQFGAAVARELAGIRTTRLAVESHYVPTAQDTFETAAAKITASPEEYRRTLEEVFPHVPESWVDQMMTNQQLQPQAWQRRELHKLAVSNERVAAALADRPEVPENENPNFTSHPVTALESRIDALIALRGDPTSENNVRYLAQSDEGNGYGTVNIKIFAQQRLDAWRHSPIDHSGKA
jgi:hypothetical protein